MADPGEQCRELWSPLQQELWVFFYFLSNTKTYKMTECKAECNEIILSCHEYTILLYILSNLCWGFELIGALGSFHKLSHWKLFDLSYYLFVWDIIDFKLIFWIIIIKYTFLTSVIKFRSLLFWFPLVN